MRAAVIRDGVVVNVILVSDEAFTVPGCTVVVSDVAAKGDLYVDGQFIKPNEEQGNE